MPDGKDALAKAKSTLSGAEKTFPGSMAKGAGVTPAAQRKPAVTTPTPASKIGGNKPDVQAASDFARSQGVGGGAVGTIGVMHEGGKVPETGNYTLEKGETVIPADKSAGRNSEYRKVFIARRQARSGGGNAPVKESAEKHDSKKAEKTGQPHAKQAGAHVKK